MTQVFMVHNLVEDNGKTVRENNLEKVHNIELGSLVETDEGLRLFVVEHGRDCDGTPLYTLSFDKGLLYFGGNVPTARRLYDALDCGYPEYCLKVISDSTKAYDLLEKEGWTRKDRTWKEPYY